MEVLVSTHTPYFTLIPITAKTQPMDTNSQNKIQERFGDFVWTTKDGKEIPWTDLTPLHLDNIIKMLSKTVEELNTIMDNPPCFQGEMAQYHAEIEYENVCQM